MKTLSRTPHIMINCLNRHTSYSTSLGSLFFLVGVLVVFSVTIYSTVCGCISRLLENVYSRITYAKGIILIRQLLLSVFNIWGDFRVACSDNFADGTAFWSRIKCSRSLSLSPWCSRENRNFRSLLNWLSRLSRNHILLIPSKSLHTLWNASTGLLLLMFWVS